MAKYTNEQLIDMCSTHEELLDIKSLITCCIMRNKILKTFEDYVKCMIVQKKANKKIRTIYRILYTLPTEDIPLYVGSPKKYKSLVASWRLLNGF